jgi:hypothetical protein
VVDGAALPVPNIRLFQKWDPKNLSKIRRQPAPNEEGVAIRDYALGDRPSTEGGMGDRLVSQRAGRPTVPHVQSDSAVIIITSRHG